MIRGLLVTFSRAGSQPPKRVAGASLQAFVVRLGWKLGNAAARKGPFRSGVREESTVSESETTGWNV